ncbi:hypothetical protein GCM10010343_16640 [Streptomyces avidinii]|nr:hypothetical protein GCM10010343_16640 [Streptomyces avidinii]
MPHHRQRNQGTAAQTARRAAERRRARGGGSSGTETVPGMADIVGRAADRDAIDGTAGPTYDSDAPRTSNTHTHNG